jgi:hypothetical protein
MRHLTVSLCAFILLWFVGINPVAAAHCGLHGCHWGYANNCEFSSYRQCMQSNVWAALLGFCTPVSLAAAHRSRRAHL